MPDRFQPTGVSEPDAAVLGYGRGRTRRRLSKLAVGSFVCCLPLVLGAGVLAYVYVNPPPAASGFEGLAWFLGLYWVLGATSLAAMFLVPAVLLFGILAIVTIRAEKDRLVGTWLAIFALFLTVTIGGGLLVINLKVAHDNAEAAKAWDRQNAPAQTQQAMKTCDRLLLECRRFANANQGQFPAAGFLLRQ